MTHQHRSGPQGSWEQPRQQSSAPQQNPTGGRWRGSAHGGRSRNGGPPRRSLSRGNRRSRTRPSAGRGRGLWPNPRPAGGKAITPIVYRDPFVLGRSSVNRTLPGPAGDAALLLARLILGTIMFAHGYQKLFISLGRTAQGVENMSIPVAIVSASYVTVVELVGSVLVLAGALITVVAGCYLVVMVGAAVFVHIPTASSPRTTAGNSSAQSRRSCSRWPPQGPAGGASSVPGRAPSRHSSRCRRPRQRLLSRDCGTTALRRPDNDRCPHLHRSIRSRTMPLPRQKAAVRDDGRAPGWGVPRAATPRRARAHLERPCLPCLHGQPNVPPGTLRDCRVTRYLS